MPQFIETDPDVIIKRYRERADQYRRLADRNAERDACLRLAAIYDSLAEGMVTIRRAAKRRSEPPATRSQAEPHYPPPRSLAGPARLG